MILQFILIVLIILLHLFILSSTQFTAWPEMLSYAYLFNNGFLLYKDFALPYQPLLTLILSVIYKFFGYNLEVLVIFTKLIIITIDIMIAYFSFKVIGKRLIAVLPLLLYAILQPAFEGNQLWFDLASTPFVILGLIFLHNSGKKSYLIAGICWSLAFFIKQQHGLIFLGLTIFLVTSRKPNELVQLIAGAMIPATIILIFVIASGVIKDFWFWTVAVPIIWYPIMPGYAEWPAKRELVKIVLLFSPVVYILVKNIRDKLLIISVLIFLSCFIIAFPRYALFRLQPALAVFIILIIYGLKDIKGKALLVFLPTVVIASVMFENLPLEYQEARFYGSSDVKFSQRVSGLQGDVYLFGPHSLNYVVSGKLPPKPWIDNFVWYMEIPTIQEMVIKGLEQQRPQFVIRSTPYMGEWFELGVYQPKKISDYLNQNYKFLEKVDNSELWIRR